MHTFDWTKSYTYFQIKLRTAILFILRKMFLKKEMHLCSTDRKHVRVILKIENYSQTESSLEKNIDLLA